MAIERRQATDVVLRIALIVGGIFVTLRRERAD
jgi:hypothetical protein